MVTTAKEQMGKSPAVLAALKLAQPVLRHYVAALEKENAKLQLQIGNLEAQKVTSQNRIAALKKNSKEQQHGKALVDAYAQRLNAAKKRTEPKT